MSRRCLFACFVVVLSASGCRARPQQPQPHNRAAATSAVQNAGAVEEESADKPLPSKIEIAVVNLDKPIGTSALVADPTHLYWITPAGVRRVAKTGGASELMMSKEGGSTVTAIAASATFFAWATDDPSSPGHGAVFTRDVKKGKVRKVASDLPLPLALAADDKRVYFSTMGTGSEPASIRRVRFGGEDLETVARGINGATRISLDARSIYTISSKATANDDIVRIPKAGGAPAVLATGQPTVLGIALDDKDVFFSIAGPLETPPAPKCKKPPCPVATSKPLAVNGELRRVPKGGGTPPTMILGKLDEVGTVGVDATSMVYRQHGELFVVPKAGGTSRPALESSSLPPNLHVETADYVAAEGKIYVIAPRRP